MPHLISQSEADTFNNCRQKHWYAFGEPTAEGHGIEPLTHGSGLNRGNLGHEVLDVYYKMRLNGDPHVESYEAAMQYLMSKLDDPKYTETVVELTTILGKYFVDYGDESAEWEPLAVEKEFRYAIPGTDLIFPFRVDLIARHVPTGRVYVWDHKFLYNYYMPNTIPILPQLPKYVFTLQAMGYDIHDAMYNMISSRPNSKEPHRRINLNLYKHPKKGEQLFREQLRTMLKIKEVKEGEIDLWRQNLVRSASAFNCKNCSFLALCTDDLLGTPGRELNIRNFYKPNSYKYEEATDAD